MASFLIVDGDRNFRETLAIALRLDGHEALVASSPEVALALLAGGSIECCLVDAHHPAADALLDAAEDARAIPFATARYPEMLAAIAARHPKVRTLSKPFRAADLEVAVVPGASAA